MFENKKIFILGMARSGYEAAKVLAKRGNIITLNDMSKDQDTDKVKELEDLGVSVILGSHPDDILTKDFDYVIKNPGIRNDHKYVLFAKENNIKVINEIQMAYYLLPKNVKIIGITGSNGKTTTTTLIYEMLKNAGLRAHLTGNVGLPLSGFLDKIKEGDYIVIEIAGHHLANFIDFKTDISVLTNLLPVHLDFHGTYENYINIKKRIFSNHTKKDLAIINCGNEDCLKITEDINSTKMYFSAINKNGDAYLEDGYICYKNNKIIKTKDITLKGNHNYENMMCALIIGIYLGLDIENIKQTLANFKGVEHRIEFVRTIHEREFYNDSKSTNNKATQIAVSSFNKPIMLILGGLDRGQTFDELKDYMTNVKQIFCYGQTKDKIKSFADENNIKVTVVNNLEEATKLAYNLSSEGDVILLSPACASWDQYKCFEDRGNEFKQIVNSFK